MTTPPVAGKTILLVDDEKIILDVGGQMLVRLGHAVLTAETGRAAIEIYQDNAEEIDLIILDMILPSMNGSEIYDRLKEIDPDVDVILSSGYSLDGQAAQILSRGCRGFIQKPFTLDDLARKIGDILKQQP